MSDSQRPKFPAPAFEIPDLELAVTPRSPKAPSAPRTASAPSVPSVHSVHSVPKRQAAPEHGYSAPNLFDEDAFTSNAPSLDLDHGAGASGSGPTNAGGVMPSFGGSLDFADPGGFELEPVASPGLVLEGEVAREPAPPRASAQTQASTPRLDDRGGARAAWPSGRAADPTQVALDSVEIAILADYGEVPSAPHLTPLYAYRVFTRQRELKHELVRIASESERAEQEREAVLADLTRAVRPQAEQIDQFRRLFAPLVELEQQASQRGQALSSINAEVDAQTARVDFERSELDARLHSERERQAVVQRSYDERAANAKRAEAKLKRIEIETRNVLQVAEQKLGPQGGAIPEPELSQLEELRGRSSALQPEVDAARAELAAAKQSLDQLTAQLDALEQSDRQLNRRKQAISEAHQQEIRARSAGLGEAEQKQQSALADLGRAILSANGTVDVPAALLERVRAASERADQLLRRRELQRRAIESYDRKRAAQGVRLTLTVIGIVLVLCVLKLVF